MNQQDSLFQQPDHPGSEPAPTSKTVATEAAAEDLAGQVRLLQHQLNTLLILLLVVSGTFAVYLYPQVRIARKELERLRPQVQQLVADYTTRTEPAMRQFLSGLSEYANTHPDVIPILRKYNLTPAAKGTNQPAAAPPGTQ